MFVSVKKQIRERVQTILSTYAPIVAAMGGRTSNFINPATKAGVARQQRAPAPDTFPRIRVDSPRTTQCSAYKGDGWGFDVEDAELVTNGGTGPIDWSFELPVTFVSELDKLDEQDQLVDDAQVALLLAGPKLGLSFIKYVGPFVTQQQQVAADTTFQVPSVQRLRTVLRVQGVAQFDLQWIRSQASS